MPTYLLTWSPKKFAWNDLEADIETIESIGFYDGAWSSGNTKKIMPGDRVFMLRQGADRAGIIGSGIATSVVGEVPHHDTERRSRGETMLSNDFRFFELLNPLRTKILPREALYSGKLASVNWGTQSSGITIEAEAADELESLWAAHLENLGLNPMNGAEEIATPELYWEGVAKPVWVNAYERNPIARQRCIEHFGCRCSVCGCDFESMYGEHGKGFIHVHHLKPLSRIKREYLLDPIKDLRPICPNCHAMAHRFRKILSIEALRELVGSVRNRKRKTRCDGE